jgi:hypothetical protein
MFMFENIYFFRLPIKEFNSISSKSIIFKYLVKNQGKHSSQVNFIDIIYFFYIYFLFFTFFLTSQKFSIQLNSLFVK